jgi:hypothetical protein
MQQIRLFRTEGETRNRDSTYREILKWAIGDWNQTLVCTKSNSNSEAVESLNECIEKLTFFIDWVLEFYFAFKMRARCYRMLRRKDAEIKDLENYVR